MQKHLAHKSQNMPCGSAIAMQKPQSHTQIIPSDTKQAVCVGTARSWLLPNTKTLLDFSKSKNNWLEM